jgi:hypothetical protein
VRQDDELVPRSDRIDRDRLEAARGASMRDRRHARGERTQDRRGALQRVLLQRFAAREHQHDDRPGEVLAERRRGHDRDSSEKIGADLPANQLGDQPDDEREPAQNEHGDKGKLDRRRRDRRGAQSEVNGDPRERDPRDDEGEHAPTLDGAAARLASHVRA